MDIKESDKVRAMLNHLMEQRIPKEDIQFIITTASAGGLMEEAVHKYMGKIDSIFGHRVEVFDIDTLHEVYGLNTSMIAVVDKKYFEELVGQMRAYEIFIGGNYGQEKKTKNVS